jgi:predicted enzyme related to lactoylglutathione lyase
MLRGISTMNLWAEDLPAAARWYTELLGVEPYFTSEAAGRGSGYVEFRIGDYQHELGIIERMKAAGAEFTMPPTKVTGSTSAMVNDTCGNLIQIAQLGR